MNESKDKIGRVLMLPFKIFLILSGVSALSTMGEPTISSKFSEGKLRLAINGQPQYKIVINSNDIIPQEREIARQIAFYLGLIVKSDFSIVEEHQLSENTSGIYVGKTTLASQNGICQKSMDDDKGVIKTIGKNLIISGGRPFGTLNVGWVFLEEYIGCRWYTVFDEFIPRNRDLSVDLINRDYRPTFRYRDMYRQGQNQRGSYGGEGEFYARNRLRRATAAPRDVHTFELFFNPRDYFKEHPEYASLDDKGKRHTNERWQFCTTNADVRKIVLKNLKEIIRKNPNVDFYEVSANDGNRERCNCHNCSAIEEKEGVAGPFMSFINYLADNINSEFPKAIIRTLAYNVTVTPTISEKYRQNVAVRLCFDYKTFIPITDKPIALPESPDLTKLKEWGRRASQIHVWDYDGGAYGQIFPQPIFDGYTDRLRTYLKHDVRGVFLETEMLTTGSRPFVEMRHWVYMKLAEDPQRNVYDLIKDYSQGIYGKAAPAIVELIKYIEKRKYDYPHRFYDYNFFKKAYDCLEKAEKLTENNPRFLARVHEARFSIDLTTLYYWGKACTDHIRSGGNMKDWNFPKEAIINRTENYLDTLVKENRWLSSKLKPILQKQFINPIISCARVVKTPIIPPENFSSFPPESIVDLPVPVLGWIWHSTTLPPETFKHPQPDTEAASGSSIFISEEIMKHHNGSFPMVVGLYDLVSKENITYSIKREDIKGPGYNWYKVGPFHLKDTAYIYLTKSWGIQINNLQSFLNKDMDNQLWHIYVSMKTSGPDMPYGNENTENGLFIDRVMLIKTERNLGHK